VIAERARLAVLCGVVGLLAGYWLGGYTATHPRHPMEAYASCLLKNLRPGASTEATRLVDWACLQLHPAADTAHPSSAATDTFAPKMDAFDSAARRLRAREQRR
jgi:hypothetical protein